MAHGTFLQARVCAVAACVAGWLLQEEGWEEASKRLDSLQWLLWLVGGVQIEVGLHLEGLHLQMGAAQTPRQRH